MSLATRLYATLPVLGQDALFSLYGLRLRGERYGGQFANILASLQESQWWTASEIESYQNERVRRMVGHAYENVAWYREQMDRVGVSPDAVDSVAALSRLPILTKSQARLRASDLVSTRRIGGRWRTSRTSGTSGTPLKIFLTPEAAHFEWAVVWRHRARFGLTTKSRFLMFGARLPVSIDVDRPPYWRRDWANHRVYLSTYHLTPGAMESVLGLIDGGEFEFLTGYPSAMYSVARFIAARGVRLEHPPRYVVSASETLLPSMEAALGRSFQAPVTDHYGCSEACGAFSRCEQGRYHLDAELGAVEMLPVPGAHESRLRRLVFTGLINEAMPLIRYDIGDLGLVSEGPCPCGLQSPSLDRIEGRTEDMIRTPDGRLVIGMNQVFQWAPHLLEAQVRQEVIDAIRVLVVAGPGFGEADLSRLEAELRARLGPGMRIELEMVESIPRMPNGKFRVVVSTLAPMSPEEQDLRSAVVGDERSR